jgi:hypothetical protein
LIIEEAEKWDTVSNVTATEIELSFDILYQLSSQCECRASINGQHNSYPSQISLPYSKATAQLKPKAENAIMI